MGCLKVRWVAEELDGIGNGFFVWYSEIRDADEWGGEDTG